MAHRVAAHRVAGVHHHLRVLRERPDAVADEEERRRDVQLLQQRQEFRGILLGAVVKREVDDAARRFLFAKRQRRQEQKRTQEQRQNPFHRYILPQSSFLCVKLRSPAAKSPTISP